MISATLVVLSWLLIGSPLPLSLAIEGILTVALMSVLRYRFSHKTIALIGMMGLMLTQCIVIVFMIHFQVWQPLPHSGSNLPGAWLFQTLFRLNFPLAELGAAAAICIGIYIEFGRSRLNLSEAFPNVSFYEPTYDLVQTVKALAKKANIECPDLSLVDSGAPSAFTVRTRGKYTIAVSIGLLESFENSEVEACIAHEISHIKNRDFALRSVVTVARIALFARLLSYLVETAFYRTRELLADRTAALLLGGAEPLIAALTKLQNAEVVGEPLAGGAICSFDGKKSVLELFSKHPNLGTRIRLLKEMEPVLT